jgi:uncharacterized membrane protein
MSTDARQAGSNRALLLIGLSYPLSAHLAVLSGRPALIAASVGVLVMLVLVRPLRRGRRWAWAALVAAAVGLYALSRSHSATLPLFAPPVLINGCMAWVFGHTLRAGEMPLIERIVRALHEPGEILANAIVAYARRLTWAWTALFVILAAVNLALASCATPGGLLLAAGVQPPIAVPLATWSLFANVLNYVFVGAFFVVEYALRRRRFPQQSYRSIVDFTQRVARLGPAFWSPNRRRRAGRK